MCNLIADILVRFRTKHTKWMMFSDVLDVSECLEDAPYCRLWMMLPTGHILPPVSVSPLTSHKDWIIRLPWGLRFDPVWEIRNKMLSCQTETDLPPIGPPPSLSTGGHCGRPGQTSPQPSLFCTPDTCRSVGVQPREIKINWLWTHIEAEEQEGENKVSSQQR